MKKGGRTGSRIPKSGERGDRRSRDPAAPKRKSRDPGQAASPSVCLSSGRILLLSLGFGIWTGMVESIPPLVAPRGGVVVRLSRDFLWMSPLADLSFFVLASLSLLVLARVWPKARSRGVVTGVFAGMTTLMVGLVPERLHPIAVCLLAVGVGTQVSRWVRGPVRRPRILPVLAAVGALVILGGTARMELRQRAFERYWLNWLPDAPAGAPNVILLILDTVRGASLEFLPDLRPQSQWAPVSPPTLDSLAARSVVFTRAMAPSPWTLPSHESMFTGRWANRLAGESRIGLEWVEALVPWIPTLPEVLARHGYLTAGFVGNLVFTSTETGLARGFLTYRDYEVSPAQTLLSSALGRRLAGSSFLRRVLGYHEVLNRKDARAVADQFLRWHQENGDRPFFAFLNFFDGHEPYLPPDSVRRAMPRGNRWDDFTHFVGLLTGATALRNNKWEMTPAEQAAHASGYHAAILREDEQIRRILGELDRRGALDNTIVIMASDHGEQLGEHDLYNHNNSLYLTALHVPLLVLDPIADPQPTLVGDVVSLRDMASTILDLAGVDADSAGIQGRSLARYWRDVDGGAEERQASGGDPAFAVLYRGAENEPWYPVERGPAMYSLTDSAYHYILSGDGTEELFHISVDPAESMDLIAKPGMESVLNGFRSTLRVLAPEATNKDY